MMKNTLFILPLMLLLFNTELKAQDFTKYEKGSFNKGEDHISYRILYPENFNSKQEYPIVFFLHGSGESGDDNEKQLNHGGSLFLKEVWRKRFPAIVVFPQCPQHDSWSNSWRSRDETGKSQLHFQTNGNPTKPMHALLGMIDNLLEKSYVDKNRVYIGGLSIGGMGTYELLRRKPKTFAAAFVICGGDTIANVPKYKDIPIWIFQGGKDTVVPPIFAKKISDYLKIHGKEVRYTLYQDDAHNSWDSAFAQSQLLPWLFSHTKEQEK